MQGHEIELAGTSGVQRDHCQSGHRGKSSEKLREIVGFCVTATSELAAVAVVMGVGRDMY